MVAPAPLLGVSQREAHQGWISLNLSNKLGIAATDTVLKPLLESLQNNRWLLIIEMRGASPLLFIKFRQIHYQH